MTDSPVFRIAFATLAATGLAASAGAVNLVSNPSFEDAVGPATWALLIAGFGMAGLSIRRRRARLTSAVN